MARRFLVIAAAKEIVRVHFAGAFVILCIVGSCCGIIAVLAMMFGGKK